MKEIEELKVEYLKDEMLSKHTTYKVGGPCKYMVFPKNVDELIKVCKLIKEKKIDYKVLGNGSNVVFSSKEYNGVIINLSKLNEYKLERTVLYASSGCSVPMLALYTVNNGLEGMEFATGFPASVGGAICMNAGCYGSSMSEITKEVTYLDENLDVKTVSNKECHFTYRNSIFKNSKKIVLSATFKLRKGNLEELKKIVNERMQKRIASQPLEKPSAGSVFKNPEGNYAGKLIEDAGLKGKQVGGAKISEKHANFIINEKNATGEDIKKLVSLIKEEIEDRYNIKLETEQEFINF